MKCDQHDVEVTDLRSEARGLLAMASSDGRLDRALFDLHGHQQMAKTRDLRAEAKALLASTNEDGRLGEVLAELKPVAGEAERVIASALRTDAWGHVESVAALRAHA